MVTFVVFDYLQLLRAGDVTIDGDNRHEVAAELIKEFCVVNNIVGVVASQVTKKASRASKDTSDTIDGDEMLYVRTDKLNLAVTLNVMYNEQIGPHGIGVERIKTSNGWLNVTKNSYGETGRLNCMIDWKRGVWLVDKAWEGMGHVRP